jgi:membrane-bound inhibitor of C-type lysozyme
MANEFYRRGTSKVYFLATAPAITASPTTVEISAGIDLSPQLNGLDGFSFKTTFIDVENLATRVTTTISGPTKADGGTITFNEKRAASGATSGTYDTIMDALDVDSTGVLLFAPYGVVAGNDVEIWPVTIGSFSRKWDMGNTTAKWMAEFAATAAPTQHATIGAYVNALDVAPSTATVDVSDASIKKLTATATKSDAATSDVSYLCSWTSSDVTKATVSPGGWVTPVAAGSTTVTATYVSPTGTTFTDTSAITVTA